jgi:hypothetical protein
VRFWHALFYRLRTTPGRNLAGYDGASSEVNQNAVINRIRLARGKVASQAMDERPKAAIEVIFNTFQWNVGD